MSSDDLASERGSVGIVLLGVVAVALALAVGVAMTGTILRARVEAAAAADAAALAAAPVTFLPFGASGTPAEEAALFARLNGARLVSCRCPVDPSWTPRTVIVEVARTASIAPFGVVEVRAVGRARFEPAALLGG